MTAPNINMFVAQMILDHLVEEGAELAVISPGSRSTPLTVAAHDHDRLTTRVIIDERAAAFYALGYARATGRAPIVICTSGTAAANYYPAVIEAYQSRLPLFVLTADRPEELQNRGANQTINQVDLYGGYAISLTVPAPSDAIDPHEILTAVDTAVKETWGPGRVMQMPLHLNCRFREPLAPREEPYRHEGHAARVRAWYREQKADVSGYADADIDEAAIESIAGLLAGKRRGIIVAGPEAWTRAGRKLGVLSERLKWPILADVLSQRRFCSLENTGHVMGLYDLYLDCDEAAVKLAPEAIIHVGGLPTSKRLNQFLYDNRGVPYLKIQSHERLIDPDGVQTHRLEGDLDRLTMALAARLERAAADDWLSEWLSIEYACLAALNRLPATEPLNEISTPMMLARMLERKEALFLSSSMPVRDADSFMPHGRKAVHVGANRGVSGIDGVIASACGFAAGCRRPTTLLIGDLAFLHDMTSLELVAKSDYPVTVVAVNNHGGGIFHFLPIAEHEDVFESCFGTPHAMNFEAAADQFGLSYSRPGTLEEFELICRERRDSSVGGVIEIDGDRDVNRRDHDRVRGIAHHAARSVLPKLNAKLDVRWNLRTTGDKDKPAIIFLHGFMGSGGIWQPTMDALGDAFHCLAPDLPGHGATEADLDRLDFESLAAALANLAGTLDDEQPILAGYSMGGRIALYTAMRYPELFRGLILESSTAGIDDDTERCDRRRHDDEIARKLAGCDMREFLTDWYGQSVFAYLRKRPGLIERIIEKKTSNDPGRLAKVVSRLSPGRQPSLWEKLARWDKPTLILTGDKDEKYDDIGRRLEDRFPNARRVIVPEAGHIVHLENHEAFMSALKSALASYIL